MSRRPSVNQGGFTLIELLIALAIMAAAAVTLIGMQSAAIARTLRDRDAQQGMLLARRIMASIEAGSDNPMELPTFDNESGVGALQKFGIPEPTEENDKRALSPFQVTLVGEELQLPLPNIDQDPLRKLTLRVSWGQASDQTFMITYLMAIPKQ
jgi:prepilin-type N-terminal cleavage/methylation domain-containing protein